MERTIEASTTLRASIHQVQVALLFDPGCLVRGERPSADVPESELRSTLAVETSVGPSIHQEVIVQFGALCPEGDNLSLAVTLRATSSPRLFPRFVGELEATPYGPGTVLRLYGTYGVPLSPFGRFGDGIARRRLARQSLTTFLEQAAGRLDAEADRQARSGSWVPDRYPVAVRELAASENYLG
ncbi:MAG TPA: hypothetical protein VG455_00435 [Acidimicrobiales bacterium]|nr:hypothetical protein [Acidimicrobiales bacterium]